MQNLAYALLASAVVLAGLYLGAHLGFWASLLPALITLVGVFFVLSRRTTAKVKTVMDGVQKDLQAGKMDRAIEAIQAAFPLASQQFLLGSQLHGALGVLLYTKRDFQGALPHLKKSFFRDWQAQATLGACCYQLKDLSGMEQAFERAVTAGKKEGLAWSAYAFALQKAGEREKAQKVMARAVDANPQDERLKSNLTALQNNKKMKMRAYEPQWFQFHLERLPPEMTGGKRVVWQRR
jgi:tetratricopeptide (TPR) repeat protein